MESVNTKELIAHKMSEKESEIGDINETVNLLNLEIDELDKQKDTLINVRNPHLAKRAKLQEEYNNLEAALRVVEEVEIMPIGMED